MKLSLSRSLGISKKEIIARVEEDNEGLTEFNMGNLKNLSYIQELNNEQMKCIRK